MASSRQVGGGSGWRAGVGLALLAVACGSAAGGGGPGAAGGAGASAGGASGASGAGGVAGADAGSGGASGLGGGTLMACGGNYANPRTLLSAGIGDALASPTLSSDELELFYAQLQNGAWSTRRSVRASKSDVFPDGSAVSELDAACGASASRTLELSADGLRVYVHCEPDGLTTWPVIVARRTSRDAAFVLDSVTYGDVGASLALSANELTLYSTSETQVGTYSGPVFYTRGDTSSPFGAAMPVPGLESTTLHAPDLSPDGQALFGAIEQGLVVALRDSTGAFQLSATPPLAADTSIRGAPAVSADCGSLYFIEVPSQSMGVALPWSIRVASHIQ